jgi:hypothetical protein
MNISHFLNFAVCQQSQLTDSCGFWFEQTRFF